jgi:biotin/methionine sulfoxide reductase
MATINGKLLRRSAAHWGAFLVEVEDGRMRAVHPFPNDPSPSPVLGSIIDSVYAQTRITSPMVRAGWLDRGPGANDSRRGTEPFVQVSWERALDLVALELRRVKERYGNAAIFGGSYGWGSAGRFHHANFQLYRFLNHFGGFTEKTDSYSFAAGVVLMRYVVGTSECVVGRSTSWASMVGNTRLMVMFGGLSLKNTQMEYGGTGRHTTSSWLQQIKNAGAKFVSIGLMKDDALDFLEAEWWAPRPNTDTALMLGLAHTLVAESLYDRSFVDLYCTGFDRFLPYLMGHNDGQPKDAVWAAGITGLPADDIRKLARQMASVRTMITVTWSLQRADHGEQPYWMATTLAAMLGQIGLPGGGVGFGYACESGMGMPREWIAVPTLPVGKNSTGSSIPVARISDMLLNPGGKYHYLGQEKTYPDIHLIYWCGGNPFHHHQDLNQLIRAWQKPETIIVHEPWWTSTARHADIVLPATTAYERMDIAYSSRDRFILAMDQVIAPVGEARDDHRIFTALADRLGFGDAFTEGRTPEQWVRQFYERYRESARLKQVTLPEFDAFWEKGFVEVSEPEAPFVLFDDFRRAPDRYPLDTPSGRIEIYSETIASYGYDDCPPHPSWIEPCEWLGGEKAQNYPLHLISNQPRTRLHGQTDGVGVSLASKINGREPLWIHPDDATQRGVHDGDIVRVFNDRGATLAGAVVTPMIRRSVIQLAVGATFDPEFPGISGSLDKHGNANVLTRDKGTSKLAQASIAQTALVQVEKFEGVPPPITAFTPPAFRQGGKD